MEQGTWGKPDSGNLGERAIIMRKAIFALAIVFLIALGYATDGVVAYRSSTGSGVNFPKLRFWNSTGTGTWGSEVELATSGAGVNFTRVKYSSISHKLVLVTQGADGFLDAYVCLSNCNVSGSWAVTNNIVAVGTGGSAQRRFSIDYESATGDLLVVASANSTSGSCDLTYTVLPAASTSFSGLTWTCIDDTSVASDVVYTWVQTDANPVNTSEQIVIAGFDSTNSDVGAWVWNGSAVGNYQELTATGGAGGGYEAQDVRYASDGSKGMVVGGSGTAGALQYQFWNGTAWSTSASAGDLSSGNDDVSWINSRADPSTDDIMVISLSNSGPIMSSAYWNGSAWSITQSIDTAVDGGFISRAAAFAFNSSASRGILAWDTDTTGTTLSYRNWTGSWSATATISTYAGTGAWLKLFRNPTTTDNVKIIGLRMNSTASLGAFWWNGAGGFTNYGDAAITATASGTTTESFDFDYLNVYDTTVPSVTNTAVNASSVNTGESICINATATDLSGVSAAWAQVRFPNGTYQNFTMSDTGCNAGSAGDNIYGIDISVGSTAGTLTINTTFANDTFNNIGFQSPYPNLQVTVSQVGSGSSCGPLATANQAITLTQNLSSDSTCYTVSAANVSIDCNGYTINQTSAGTGYGVLSDQFNTTVKNCVITNFLRAVYFNGADNGTIINTNMSSTASSSSGVVLENGATNNIINMCKANFSSATTGIAMYISPTGTNTNNIINNSILISGGDALVVRSASNQILNTNSTSTDSSGIGKSALYVTASSNTFYNVIFNQTASTGFTAYSSGGSSNTYNASKFQGVAKAGLTLLSISSNNIITNNTFLSTSGIHVDLTSGTGNTFYWNNFTSTTGSFVRDTVGTNYYNSTEGNIWFNVQNGSVVITGTSHSSAFPSLYIGSAGPGYPYNNSTSQSKFSCNFAGCADNKPLTPTQANNAPTIFAISVVPSSPTVEDNISCNITVRDAEQSTTNITYEWYKNGVNQTSLAGTFNNLANNTATLISNLTSGNLSVGQNWSCNVRAYDGTDYSSWSMSSNVTISDSATVTMCRNLATAGQTYTLQNSVSISGATCFNVTAANVTLNCNGYSITGSNTTSTYGIYSNQFNTTVTGCTISNFSNAILFSGSNNGSIINTIANTTKASSSAINLTSSSNNTIRNVTAYSLSDSAISLESSSNKNNITNTSATGSSGIDISSSNNSFISGSSVAGISLTSSGYSDIRHTSSTKGITLSSSSSYNNLTNVTVSSGSAVALTLQSSSTENRFYNSSFTSTGANAITISSANSNYFTNATATTTASSGDAVSISTSAYISFSGSTLTATPGLDAQKSGLFLFNSNSSNFTGNTIRNNGGLDPDYYGIGYGAYVQRGSGHIFANNTFETYSSTNAALAVAGSSSNQFINNTLQAANGATLAILSDYLGSSTNNTFYWNNFTDASVYLNDTSSGTNYLNTTNGTQAKGNRWYNVVTGSVIVSGTVPVEWLPGYYYGSSGAGYPYNSSTSGGKIIGSGADYAPMTPPHAPTIAYSLSFVNYTAAHSFNVSAGVTDLDGASDINFTNISTTAGACTYLSNSTAGNNFNVTYNCTATSPATPSIVIGFKDRTNEYVQTSSASNAYPDHAASLTAPSVTSPLYANSIATCTAGTFSDIDSDTENTSARTWSWYRNGTIISGQTASTLNLAAIGITKGENVSCRQNATNSTWPSSNATALSTNVTVSNSLPTTSTPTLSPTTAYKNTSQISCINSTTSDADGDAVSFYYLWFKNGTSTGITTQNITNSSFNKADRLVCQITPYDGTANGTSQNSSSITISNTRPTTSAPTLSPSPAYKNTSQVSCLNGTTTDIDGDAVNFYYLWYKNGTSTGITTQNITNSSYNRGDQLICEITPYDNSTTGDFNVTKNGSSYCLNIARLPDCSTRIFRLLNR
ncbi:MAG: right-handed parallel beta-helix repeat-containing protein [Candidatus Anstonellaceae archaeon]